MDDISQGKRKRTEKELRLPELWLLPFFFDKEVVDDKDAGYSVMKGNIAPPKKKNKNLKCKYSKLLH